VRDGYFRTDEQRPSRFAEMNKMEDEFVCLFLLEVDRLKSRGNICDIDILIAAHKTIEGRIAPEEESLRV
jgi:hypothetical protein